MVGSGNTKTPEKWYVVLFDQKLDCFICDCPAWAYSEGGTAVCCHVLATCYFEGVLETASKQKYECFTCRDNGFPGVLVYLAGKDEHGKAIRIDDNGSAHVH